MNATDWLKDNSTHILTGFAVTGVIGTVLLAVKATPRVWADIQAHEEYMARLEELPDEEVYKASPKEKLKIAWKPYLPALITGACTITAIIGSHAIGQKKQTALAAGIALTQRAYAEYKDGVLEEVGERKEEEIRSKVSQKSLDKKLQESKEVILLESEDELCYDRFSGRVFYSTREKIRKAENDVMAGINNFEYASLNDFWRRLGIEDDTAAGEVLGFNSSNPISVEFSSHLVSGSRPALAIDFHHSPISNYYKGGPWL